MLVHWTALEDVPLSRLNRIGTIGILNVNFALGDTPDKVATLSLKHLRSSPILAKSVTITMTWKPLLRHGTMYLFDGFAQKIGRAHV